LQAKINIIHLTSQYDISVRAPHVESVLELPPEVMLKIFVYLGFVGTCHTAPLALLILNCRLTLLADLANCALVCHQWKAVSSDDALWKRYLQFVIRKIEMETEWLSSPSRMYYEVWGTNAKTWKQLFASHYPDHEQIDMQQLIQGALHESRLTVTSRYARGEKCTDGAVALPCVQQ
jgi:hypothetical protein